MMVSLNPEERRALEVAVATAAATAAATAGVNWLVSEAQRLVQAWRDRRAATGAADAGRG